VRYDPKGANQKGRNPAPQERAAKFYKSQTLRRAQRELAQLKSMLQPTSSSFLAIKISNFGFLLSVDSPNASGSRQMRFDLVTVAT
jgi:hypothetical protein